VLSGCSNNPYPAGESAKNIHYVVLGDILRHMDPVNSYRVDEGEVIDNIYAEFFKYDYLKRTPFVLDLSLGAAEPVREPYHYIDKSSGKPVPKVGESWTFHIKHGLHFQDDPCFPGGKGREIVAADFLYSFRRMADPANNCPIVNFVSDKILGFSDYTSSPALILGGKKSFNYTLPVEGLQVDPKDPYTFRILLNQPYPQLRFLMAMHFTAPIAHEATEKYGDLQHHPVGCGQYILTENIPRQSMVLSVNPNRPVMFYPSTGDPDDQKNGLLADAGKQLPLTDEVHYVFINEAETSWNFFLQGYLDSAGVRNDNYQQVVAQQGQISPAMAAKGVTMRKDVEAEISYYAFNMTDPVVGGYTDKKRKLRQALSMAIDSQTFIDLFSQGVGIPAQFMLPPGIYGYDPEYNNPYRQNDLKQAKELLAEAGYPGGVDPKTGQPLVIYYDNAAATASGRQQVDLLHKQLAAINVNCVSRTVRDIVWQDKLDHGQFQLMSYGWVADYPDPENFLGLFYSKNLRPGPNHSGYSNSEYDRLFEQMRSMDDGPARLAVIKKMRDLVVNDCPMTYNEHPETLSIHYDWLHNVKPHPIALDTLQYEWIDGNRRASKEAEWNHPIYWPVVLLFSLIVLGSLPAIQVINKRRTRYIRKGQGK